MSGRFLDFFAFILNIAMAFFHLDIREFMPVAGRSF